MDKKISDRSKDDPRRASGSAAEPGPGYFLSDIQELRRRARVHIETGAVPASYSADLPKVIAVMNEALATELVCVLRYKRHFFMATGIHATAVAAEFQEH